MNLVEAKKAVLEGFDNAIVEGDPVKTLENCVFYLNNINERYHEANIELRKLNGEIKGLLAEIDWAESQRDEKAVGYFTALLLLRKGEVDSILKLTDRFDERLDALQVVATFYLYEAKRLEDKRASRQRVRAKKSSKSKSDQRDWFKTYRITQLNFKVD